MKPIQQIKTLLCLSKPLTAIHQNDIQLLIHHFTPNHVPFDDFLLLLCEYPSSQQFELIFRLLTNYLPSYQTTYVNYEDISFLHKVDYKTRIKDIHYLNHALDRCALKLKKKNINCHLMNGLMSVGILVSGISDERGLIMAISKAEGAIGLMDIHPVRIYDDEPDDNITDPQFASGSITRLISFMLTFFDTQTLGQFLNTFSIQTKTGYDLEKFWLHHSDQLESWFKKTHIELFLDINRHLQSNGIINKEIPLRVGLNGLEFNLRV